MSDKNIDKDILLLREIQANFKLEEGINREISGIYNSVTKRFIHDYMIVNSIENVLSELKIKDKMIDKMAEDIKEADEYLSSELNFIGYENNSIEEIKEDYRKMVEKVD